MAWLPTTSPLVTPARQVTEPWRQVLQAFPLAPSLRATVPVADARGFVSVVWRLDLQTLAGTVALPINDRILQDGGKMADIWVRALLMV